MHLWRHALCNLCAGRPFAEPDAVERAIRDIDAAVRHLVGPALDGGPKDGAPDDGSPDDGFLRRLPPGDALAQARQLFSFDHDASALALFWALYELGRHPDVVRRLRAELRRPGALGFDFDALRSLPYLDAVVAELLRLHPPISATARRVTQPIAVETRDRGTVVLPRGAQLFASLHLLHRDRRICGPTADDFAPDRWLGVNANSRQNRCEYLPFLAGPRACPSSAFVLLQIKTMLAVLLSRADLVIPNPADVDKIIGGVIYPAKPVRFEVREVRVDADEACL